MDMIFDFVCVMLCVFVYFGEFVVVVGDMFGVSVWFVIDQICIDGFVDVMGDYQWVYVDLVCVKEGLFGVCIVYGYLMLVFVNYFLLQIVCIDGVWFGVNYGCDRICFFVLVKVGVCVCGVGELLCVELFDGGVQVWICVIVEIDGEVRFGCVVDMISCYYFQFLIQRVSIWKMQLLFLLYVC